MNWKGHVGLALLTASPFALAFGVFLGTYWSILTLGAAVLTDRIPDKDQQIPLISHRGITHTFFFGSIVSGVLAMVLTAIITVAHPSSVVEVGLVANLRANLSVMSIAFFGFMLGFTSHLLGDILTEAYDYTVSPFWPFSRAPVVLGWIESDSKRAWEWVFVILGALATVGVVVGLRVLQ